MPRGDSACVTEIRICDKDSNTEALTPLTATMTGRGDPVPTTEGVRRLDVRSRQRFRQAKSCVRGSALI